MLGRRSDQLGLFEADHLYLGLVGRDSFYGLLACHRGELFADEEFARRYVVDNGRPSVPPSLLATALLLQSYEGVSDQEAKGHADFDLRWKVALGIEIEDRPFAKSTLQLFRSQLVLHDELQGLLKKSLTFARRQEYFRSPRMKVVLDTSNILGRGAVKDTYNLLADGIGKLARVLAGLAGEEVGALELVEQAEGNAAAEVEEAIGDCAFGDGKTRAEFAEAGRKLVARVAARPDRAFFPKEDFGIDLEKKVCVCPAGQECRKLVPAGKYVDQ